MIHASIRRAVLRLDRNWISGAVLTAGIVLSIAGFLYLRHEEHDRAAAAFRAVAAGRSMAVCRETESYQHLLKVVAHLAADGQTGAIAASLDSFRGTRPGGLLAVWVPWNGAGDGAPAANRPHRFTAGPGFPGDGGLPWLADALRCAARAGHPLAVPAAADGAGELLVLATPVYGAVRRLRGVALVMTPLADVVRYALGPSHLAGVDLSVVDAGLGGRQLYPPASRVGPAPAAPPAELTTEVPFAFAGRSWTLRASPSSAFPSGGNVRARRGLLVAWLLTSLLLAAIARQVFDRARRVRALVAGKGRRLREANRRLRLEARERRDAEQRLNLALDAAGMGIWDWDISAGRTTATPEIFRIFGLPPADTFPAHDEWLSLIHPDDRARMEQRLGYALEANSAFEAEYRIVRPDGAIRWLLSKARLFRDASGNPQGLLGVNIDITGMREAESALTETQERTRRVFANAAVGAVLADLDGRFLEVNDFACRATGYTREELLSMRLVELVHPEDRDFHARRSAELMRAAAGGYVAEVRLLHRCGETRWMRVSASPASRWTISAPAIPRSAT